MTVSSRKMFSDSHEFIHKLLTIIVNRALYLRGDPYENSDAVFGVKESLITTLGSVSDVEGLTEKYGVAPTTKLLKHDFVLITDEESDNLREQNAWKEAQRRGGLTVKDGLLVKSE